MTNNITFSENQLLIEQIESKCCGSLFLFLGKNTFDGNSITKLEYETNQSTVIQVLEQICFDIRDKWKEVENIVIHYRLGEIPSNEYDLIIGISVLNNVRTSLVKALDFCIDNLKQLAVKWRIKNEISEDHSSYTCRTSRNESKVVKNFDIEWKVEINNKNYIPPHLIQVKASKTDIDQRIEKFIKRRRDEIDVHNIAEFLQKDRDPEFTCARLDTVLVKRKNAKSHLKVTKVLNKFYADQNNPDYIKKFIPSNGIEERLENLESQLNLNKSVPKNIYERLKCLENRMLVLEAVSPEYIQFWDKFSSTATKTKKRKIFTLDEIDELIAEAEEQRKHS